MIVWWFISLFFLWSFSPEACILFVLSGVLFAIARIKTTDNRRNKRDYRTIENSMRKFDEKIQNNTNSNLFK